MLAFDDLLEAADGLLERNILALVAGELLGNGEGLAQEALHLTGAVDGQLTDTLAARIQANAPKRTGELARGIIVSPAAEQSSASAKIVRDIYFDASMNDTFVKTSREGKRYYYPASQEYGFRKVNGGRVPGRYYIRDTAVEYAAEHRNRVADGIDNVLEEL